MKHLGVHLGGGIENIAKVSTQLGINTIQMMPTAPIRWVSKDLPEEQAVKTASALKTTPIKKVLMHGIYLINLARKDKQLFHLSKISLVYYLNFAEALKKQLNSTDIEILGICFHAGSVKDLPEKESFDRVQQGLNWILQEAPKGDLLLETSAGAGGIIGDTLEELAQMRESAEQKDRIAYVLDTQHMFASGYDWVNDLDGVINKIESILGLDKIKCIHLNDSAVECGSHKDRHANLGDGKIGEEGIKRILKHEKLKNIPFILETPDLKGIEGIEREYKRLLSLAG